MTQAPPPPDMTFQRSGRDPAALGAKLERWLATALPPGADPSVALLGGIDANGLSSETVLLDVTSTEGGVRGTKAYVLRVAPRPQDIPVFATYDLQAQYDAMRLAGSLSAVPVPEVGLAEMSGSVLGTPFFLMERVEGVVPPDVMPYSFGDSWLFAASPADRAALQRRSIEVLAGRDPLPLVVLVEPRPAGRAAGAARRRRVETNTVPYRNDQPRWSSMSRPPCRKPFARRPGRAADPTSRVFPRNPGVKDGLRPPATPAATRSLTPGPLGKDLAGYRGGGPGVAQRIRSWERWCWWGGRGALRAT
ncbi:hypothetical protein [Nocardioides sp.]|uniref:hypothetical protein n=1 Tax=Nocardioides sp. TaxID=35761 RepID=UPI0019BF4B25|nr:hypothetical protein [Nocardioides sp.]MBC7278599.1 hypothetical protein [Nocardioides sp.]